MQIYYMDVVVEGRLFVIHRLRLLELAGRFIRTSCNYGVGQ